MNKLKCFNNFYEFFHNLKIKNILILTPKFKTMETPILILLIGIIAFSTIFLATIKTPLWFIKLCGEMYVAYLIVKNHFRAFFEYTSIPLVSYITKAKFYSDWLKNRQIKKRAEKLIKSGDIYSKKQV